MRGTGDQLKRAEGLDHVIVRAQREALDLVSLRVSRGQHDDGIRMVVADGAQQLEAVDVRQHDVQHRQVELVCQDLSRRIRSRVGKRYLVALVL